MDTQRVASLRRLEEFNVINRRTPSDSVAYLKEAKAVGLGAGWQVRYSVRQCTAEVPREMLAKNKPLSNFKWSDNMQEDGGIMDFYLNGDVAPGGLALPLGQGGLSEEKEMKGSFSISTTAAIIIASSIVLLV